jgi:hypothetical protein
VQCLDQEGLTLPGDRVDAATDSTPELPIGHLKRPRTGLRRRGDVFEQQRVGDAIRKFNRSE